MVDPVEELAQMYEKSRDELEKFAETVHKIKQGLDEKREFEEEWVWCRKCGHRHRPWSDSTLGHPTQRIPKRCLTKYDHIYEYVDTREERVNEPELGECIALISISKCIVCGEKRESVYAYK